MHNTKHVDLHAPDEVPWNIAASIRRHVLQNPSAPAVFLAGRVITHGQLAAGVQSTAALLLANGISPGQTVGISMGQNAAHLITILALAHIGAVSLPLHQSLAVAPRALIARRFGATVVISGHAEYALPSLPFVSLDTVDLQSGAEVEPFATASETPFRIVLSSGTSGDPKGLLFTHGYMQQRMSRTQFGITSTSRMLPMDLNFVVGFLYALAALRAGGSVILGGGNAPLDLINAVRLHTATHWILSPAIAESIAPILSADEIAFPRLLELRVTGGMPSPKLQSLLLQRFSANAHVCYGLTETGVLSLATAEMLERSPHSVGRICNWVEAQVVDQDGGIAAVGQSGALRVRCEGMIDSYYLDDEYSAQRFCDGWLDTGDCAFFDEAGLLFIAGRGDDVLNVNGVKVHPQEIEDVLQGHPGVKEAAVFSLTNSDGSTRMAVAIVSAAVLKAGEVEIFARGLLGTMAPEKYFEIDALPRTPTGKVLRRQLADLFGDG